MRKILDSLFKSKDSYLRQEIKRKNKKSTPHMDKLMLADFCSSYWSEKYNTVISGGTAINRAIAEYALIKQSRNLKLPVIIVHTGNAYLKNDVLCRTEEGIGFYDPLVGKDSDEIADMLTDIGSNLLQGRSDLFGLWVLIADILSIQGGPITLKRLVSFRCEHVVEHLNTLARENKISSSKCIEFTNRYGAVGAFAHEAQRLLTRLKKHWEYSKEIRLHSLEDVLENSGIISIDVVSDTNDTLKELCFADINRVMRKGYEFLLIVEGISFLSGESHVNNVLLRNSGNISLLFGANDVPAMTQENNENFQTLVSGPTNIIILRHNSAESAQKWTSYIGQHFVKQIDSGFGTSKDSTSIIKRQSSSNITVRTERRDILPSEWITRLDNGQSFALEATNRRILKVLIR